MVKPTMRDGSDWTLWFETKPDRHHAEDSVYYGDRLKQVGPISAISEHKEYKSFMQSPNEMPMNSTMYVFQNEMRPMWETFPRGGCWTYRLKRGALKLPTVWQELVKACIVDGLGSKNVAGVVLGNRQREFVISIWLISGESSEQRFAVLERLRELFKVEEGDTFQYKDFHAAIKDDSSRLNAVTYRVKPITANTKTAHAPARKYILPDPVSGSFTFNF